MRGATGGGGGAAAAAGVRGSRRAFMIRTAPADGQLAAPNGTCSRRLLAITSSLQAARPTLHGDSTIPARTHAQPRNSIPNLTRPQLAVYRSSDGDFITPRDRGYHSAGTPRDGTCATRCPDIPFYGT